MLPLRKFLIPCISKHLLCKEWQTITRHKDVEDIGIHHFVRALGNTHSKLIHKQARKSITAELKIREFHNNISDVIKESITAHLPDDMTYNDILTKSEEFAALNQGGNIEHTKPGYGRKVSRYTHGITTHWSYHTLQRRSDKSILQENHRTTSGDRSTAPGGTTESDCNEIKKT